MQDFSSLIQQAQTMQKEMRKIQDDLKERIVSGEAGGGVVKVFLSGQQDVVKIEIDAKMLKETLDLDVDQDDIDMLGDLILTALKSGMEESKELSKKELSSVTGGMNLPGLF